MPASASLCVAPAVSLLLISFPLCRTGPPAHCSLLTTVPAQPHWLTDSPTHQLTGSPFKSALTLEALLDAETQGHMLTERHRLRDRGIGSPFKRSAQAVGADEAVGAGSVKHQASRHALTFKVKK